MFVRILFDTILSAPKTVWFYPTILCDALNVFRNVSWEKKQMEDSQDGMIQEETLVTSTSKT